MGVGPPPEDAVFASVYLLKAASDGTSTEWDVNASWTSVVRRPDWSRSGGVGGWVRADTFTVEPLYNASRDGGSRGGVGGGGAVVIDISTPISTPLEGTTRTNMTDADVDSGVRVIGVRHAWERYPQCSMYDGAGGWDHREDAIAATPFCFDLASLAPCSPARIPNP